MKSIKKYILLLMIFMMIFSPIACTKKPQKPSEKSEDGPKEMPKSIEEIEKDALTIMGQADMIPYFKRVIVEQEMIDQNKKIEEMEMKKAEGENAAEKPQENNQESEVAPKPKTIEESILSELLKTEKQDSSDSKEEKPPKDITETWKKINTTIKGIHFKWNVLEPLLVQESVSADIIAAFEETLDKLTIYGINQNYFATLTTANKLTSYLPKFMASFKKEVPPTLYTLKYLTRDVVLNVAVDNYEAAQQALNQIKEQGQSLRSDLVEKKAKSTADKFDASLINLQKSLDKRNMNLIRINGSIVLKNILLMKDDLSGATK